MARFTFDRKERNWLSRLAIDHMGWAGETLGSWGKFDDHKDAAREITAFALLRSDLGWERKVNKTVGQRTWALEQMSPVQLRALIRGLYEEWLDGLKRSDKWIRADLRDEDHIGEAIRREDIARTQKHLARAAELFARLDEHIAAEHEEAGAGRASAQAAAA